MTRPGRVFQQNLASSKGGDGFPALFVFEMTGGWKWLKWLPPASPPLESKSSV